MKLNDNYRIVYDSDNTVLQFFEQREKCVKDEKLGYVGTGEFKEYTENFYYPNLKTAISGFLNKCTWGTETAEQVLSEINKVEALISKIK